MLEAVRDCRYRPWSTCRDRRGQPLDGGSLLGADRSGANALACRIDGEGVSETTLRPDLGDVEDDQEQVRADGRPHDRGDEGNESFSGVELPGCRCRPSGMQSKASP